MNRFPDSVDSCRCDWWNSQLLGARGGPADWTMCRQRPSDRTSGGLRVCCYEEVNGGHLIGEGVNSGHPIGEEVDCGNPIVQCVDRGHAIVEAPRIHRLGEYLKAG